MEWIKKYKWHLVAVVVVITILLIAFFAGKYIGSNNVQLVDDSGNPVQPSAADVQKATALANSLRDDIEGLNITGHDDNIYKDLMAQSNTVFALVFIKYKELTGNSLLADINSEYYGSNLTQWGEWEVITLIKNRAANIPGLV